MTPRISIPSEAIGAARRFLRAERGVAAAEFAILLPFLLILYLGSTQLVQAMIVSRKLSIIARSLSDLVAQQPTNTTLTSAQLTDIFTGAKEIIAPYSALPLQMTVSGVDFVLKSGSTTAYDAKTRWSVSDNGGRLRSCGVLASATTGATGTPDSVPAGLYGAGGLVAADIAYTFTPSFGGGLLNWTSTPGSIRMSRTMYMRPRTQTSITYGGSSGVKCP